MKTTSVFLSSI